MANGDCLTTARRKELVIKKTPSKGHMVIQEKEVTVSFRSKAVIIATGGVMRVNPEFPIWFPGINQ